MVPVRISIHDLDAAAGGRVHVSSKDKEEAKFLVKLAGWIEPIRTGDFRPVEDRSVRVGCDFRRLCRYAPASSGRH